MRVFSLEGRIDEIVGPYSDRTVRRAVGGTMTGAGVLFLLVLLSQSIEGYATLLGLLFGGVFPVALALAIVGSGVLLLRSEFDAVSAGHVGFWWAVGSVVAAGTGVAIVVFESTNGVVLVDPAVIIVANAATGGIGGGVVGVTAARRLALARERERERQRLADERERLALLNRIVRHDIGNDLQVISGTAEYLTEHVDQAGRAPLERLQRTTDEAIDLTEQVRTFVQALDDDEAVSQSIDLRRVLRTQVDTARERHPEAAVSVDGSIPAIEVLADELLASVVHNLISNAIKHNDTDEPTVEISVVVGEDHVQLRVADDGPGVPEPVRDELFDRGELGEQSSGTGIGLYIVETLVRRYGGSVWIEDNEPRGTVFVVELPRCPDAEVSRNQRRRPAVLDG